jgi:DNA polymerase-3 subunit delta'
MHAYLITGTNSSAINKKVQEVSKKEGASIMEFEVKKIADIRQLGKFTNLKVDTKTAIYIKGIDKATTEALNAFLKNLEEPQENLFYILTANSEHNLLPTITSRCQVIRVGDTKVSRDSVKETQKFIDLKKADKLIFVKKIRKRDDANKFLEKVIFDTHYMIKNDVGDKKKLAKIAKAAEVAKTRVEAYANPNLQLTNFVLEVE